MTHALAGGIEQRDVVDDAEEFGQLAEVGGIARRTAHGAHDVRVVFLMINGNSFSSTIRREAIGDFLRSVEGQQKLVARQGTQWLVSPSAVPALPSPPSPIGETRMSAVVALRQLPACIPTSPAVTKRGKLSVTLNNLNRAMGQPDRASGLHPGPVGPGSGTDNHAINVGLRMSW
jgi:hypothetical protein